MTTIMLYLVSDADNLFLTMSELAKEVIELQMYGEYHWTLLQTNHEWKKEKYFVQLYLLLGRRVIKFSMF